MRLIPLRIDENDWREYIDELRYTFHKWDAYAGGQCRVLPLVLTLSSEEHEEVVSISERVCALLQKILITILQDRSLLQRLALPAALSDLVAGAKESDFRIARYDLIPTARGWMIPEFNEDAPGGFNENLATAALLSTHIPGLDGGVKFEEALLQAFPKEERVGLVYASGYAEDLQHVLAISDILVNDGRAPFTASPSQLTTRWGKLKFGKNSFDWIFRFFPIEWFEYLENQKLWRRANDQSVVINPLTRAITQAKHLFTLWDELSLLDRSETDFLKKHTPQTARFYPEKLEQYRTEKDTLVLKKSFGRMGDSVAIGAYCTPEQWEKALQYHLNNRPLETIVQERFSPLPLSDGERVWYPAVGPYLVNGKFAGYYSRLDRIGFTTNEAYYVATARTAAENPWKSASSPSNLSHEACCRQG